MGLPLIRVIPPIDTGATVSVALVDDYLLRWARNPDPGSWFDWLTFWRNWTPDSVLLSTLRLLHYGAQLHLEDGKVVSHIFHQRHGDALHLFSIATAQSHQKRGIARWMLREWLIEAWNTTDIKKVRISAGNDPVVVHMYEDVLAGKYDLPFGVARGNGPGWVHLIR